MVGIALVIIGCGLVEGSWMNGSSILWSIAGCHIVLYGLWLLLKDKEVN